MEQDTAMPNALNLLLFLGRLGVKIGQIMVHAVLNSIFGKRTNKPAYILVILAEFQAIIDV